MSDAESGKLSEYEVETLLKATTAEEPPAERPEPTRRVHGYDFLQPSRFKKADLERLGKINDALTHNISAQASRLLRTPIKTQLVSMDQMKWENFMDEAGEGLVAFVVALDPLGCQGVLAFERQFAAQCLDRMMGGPGVADEAEEQFVGSDVRTLSCLARAALEPLPELWRNIGQFQVVLGQFIQDLSGADLVPPDEDMFQLCFLLQGSFGSGQVTLSVPFQAVKSLPPPSGDDPEADDSVAADAETVRAGLRESLERTRVELAVLLGSADVKVQNLIKVQRGDVIVLNRRIGEALDVRVNDRIKLRGFPGVSGGKYAVMLITEE